MIKQIVICLTSSIVPTIRAVTHKTRLFENTEQSPYTSVCE